MGVSVGCGYEHACRTVLRLACNIDSLLVFFVKVHKLFVEFVAQGPSSLRALSERAAACRDRHDSESGGLSQGHSILAGPSWASFWGAQDVTLTHTRLGNKMASSSSLVSQMRRAAADLFRNVGRSHARPSIAPAFRELSAAPKRFCSGRTRAATSFVLDTWDSSFLSVFARFIRGASIGLGLMELIVSGSFGQLFRAQSAKRRLAIHCHTVRAARHEEMSCRHSTRGHRAVSAMLLLVWQSCVCFQYASHRLRAGNLHVHHAQLNAMRWRWNVRQCCFIA